MTSLVKGQWSFEGIGRHSVKLFGPQEFELFIGNPIQITKNGKITTYHNDGRTAKVTFRKAKLTEGGFVIEVSVRGDISMVFLLEYDESFGRTIREMNKYLILNED